mgnify:CR=1 FL=1
MAIVYRVDIGLSLITLTYWNGSWATENRPLTDYPELYSIILGNLESDPVLGNGPDSVAARGLPFYPVPSDGSTYALPTVAYRIDLPSNRCKTPNYSARKRAGEILMSDYDVGYIDVVSKPCRYETPTSDVVYRGNYVCHQLYDNTSINPLNLHGLGLINGHNTLVSYMLCYRAYTYDTQSSMSVPAPDIDSWNWDLFPILIDQALVTKTAADASSGAWDALTELGEFPETIKYVGNHTRRVGELITGYVRDIGKLGRLGAAPRVLASRWMEFRYAAMPIIYSIRDVRTVIKDMQRAYAEFFSISEFDAPYPFRVPSGCEVNLPTSRHRCFIKNAYTPDSLLRNLAGLVSFNLPATAWELTKMSWFVDWFLNISDCIKAYTNLHLESQSKATYAVKYDAEWTVTMTVGEQKATLTVNPNVYRRRVIDPTDHFGLSIGLSMTWKRALDSVALSLSPLSKIIRGYR